MATTLKKITLDDVRDILGRALLDSGFRDKLLADSAGTLLILGFESSNESLNFFKSLASDAFKGAAEEIENRLGGRPVIAAWL